jgi:transketolase
MTDLHALAKRLRRRVVGMASGKGEGYVGQGLQSADLMAVLFGSQLNWRPDPGDDPDVDRFVLSTGHYSIALWAAFAEVGVLSEAELDEYGADGSAVAMSTERAGGIPGVELTGGSLGHGLGVATGIAIGRRMRGHTGRTVVYLTDGELQEGSTWESVMFAGDRELDTLVAVVDVNRTQADGELVVEVEPVAEKFRSFGWWAENADGNDVESLVTAFEAAAATTGKPKAIVCHTQIGFGVPLIMARERNHFVRVSPDEWETVATELEAE